MPQEPLKLVVELTALESGFVMLGISTDEGSLSQHRFGDNLFLRVQELVNTKLQFMCNQASQRASALKKGRP
jgi:hypothetical protein